MTVIRGFAITLTSGIVGAGLGAGIGWLLGTFTPDYYRLVFHVPPDMPLNPVQAGIGLGVTQGTSAGLVVGLVIVLAVAWYESRQTGSRPPRDWPVA